MVLVKTTVLRGKKRKALRNVLVVYYFFSDIERIRFHLVLKLHLKGIMHAKGYARFIRKKLKEKF